MTRQPVCIVLVGALLLLSTPLVVDCSSEEDAPAAVIVNIEVNLDLFDRNEQCADWAKKGECKTNPQYMMEHCAASCGKKGIAYVKEGEDAAIGAFRFAEEYLLEGDEMDQHEDTIAMVLDVAQFLQEDLPKDFKPPSDILCNNKKPCSAGKLWKRAEQMRKADMHDAAGADLIRALLKTGIEVDFVERCQRTLKWAFGSVSRQREREKREAIEEEKLEQRRQEERQAMEEAKRRKEEYEANFLKFGTEIIQNELQSKASATVGADGNINLDELTKQVKDTFFFNGPQGGNYEETIQFIKKISSNEKSVDVLLIEARCHEMTGNHKLALSAAGRLINQAANYEPWVNDSPRMMAATLGANSAMQLGLSNNALQFYQTVLKFDPEQKRARTQYRGLKKVVKLMGKAEEQIQKGYNRAASVHVDDCLSAMRGLDVDSPLFRSKIQLKQCTILSGMGKHEEALENCDTAVELRLSNDSVSAASRKEAHLVRAEALLLDMDYDEAVTDFRAVFELTPDDSEEKGQFQQKLKETMHQQEMWNGGKKDWRFNEGTGYPDGMPPQRDHAKILQLPIDLEEREKEVKCAWLKKQFKTLVKKYHPDKYKGNKKRAARKFKEVKEAKEIISKEWGC